MLPENSRSVQLGKQKIACFRGHGDTASVWRRERVRWEGKEDEGKTRRACIERGGVTCSSSRIRKQLRGSISPPPLPSRNSLQQRQQHRCSFFFLPRIYSCCRWSSSATRSFTAEAPAEMRKRRGEEKRRTPRQHVPARPLRSDATLATPAGAGCAGRREARCQLNVGRGHRRQRARAAACQTGRRA